MTFGNLKKLARGYIIGAKSKTVTNTILELITNAAVSDIAAYTACLKANKKFTVTAEQREYNLSSAIGDYLVPDKPGLYWYDGSNWQRLYPRTLKYLDTNFPYWRDDDSGDPKRYSIDSDVLTLHPKGDTTLSEGLHLYYAKKPPTMTSDSHYPFSGSTTELTHLTMFDDAILEYVEWKITSKILRKKEEALVLKKDYQDEREEKKGLLARRPDISYARRESKYGGAIVC